MARLSIRACGESTVIPAKFAAALQAKPPVKTFAGRDLARQDRIFSHLASGGIAIVRGSKAALNKLLAYARRKSTDKATGSQSAYSRIMVSAKKDICDGIVPPVRIPYLAGFCGEAFMAEDQQFLIPLTALRSLQDTLTKKWRVRALDTWIVAGEDVIPPRSQETVELFQEAITAQKLLLPAGARILDMGCGSGVLTLVAAVFLGERKANILATDILPEATASTLLNINRFVSEGLVASGSIEVRVAGDLFEPIGNESFDLVIFNAPWVVASIGSRADISLNDPNQNTLRKFFVEIPQYLNANGRLILGYADNSGRKAVSRALEMADNAGLQVRAEWSARVQTHRRKRKWQRIYAWEFGMVN